MKFGYTILYVDNVEATLNFYERAFDLKLRFLAPEKNYGELETGETRLAFAAAEFISTLLPIEFARASSMSKPSAIELGFVTDNVDTAFQRALAAGAVSLKEPTKKPWGQIVGYVRDLNGFLVEICTPMPYKRSSSNAIRHRASRLPMSFPVASFSSPKHKKVLRRVNRSKKEFSH